VVALAISNWRMHLNPRLVGSSDELLARDDQPLVTSWPGLASIYHRLTTELQAIGPATDRSYIRSYTRTYIRSYARRALPKSGRNPNICAENWAEDPFLQKSIFKVSCGITLKNSQRGVHMLFPENRQSDPSPQMTPGSYEMHFWAKTGKTRKLYKMGFPAMSKLT